MLGGPCRMIPDQNLVQTARALATGANVHKLNDLTGSYMMACEVDNKRLIESISKKLNIFIVKAQRDKLLIQYTECPYFKD